MAVRVEELRSSRWAKVPRTTTEDRGLTDGEHRLLVFLIDHGTDDRGAQQWFSCPVDVMAETLGVVPRTVQNRLRQLEAKGYLRVEARHLPNGWQLTNRYLVCQGVKAAAPLASVSAGRQGVKAVSPKEEHRTTRSIRPSSSVLLRNRHKVEGSSQNGQQFKKLDLDEFKKKRKTKKAQSNPPALEGASGSPRAKPSSWKKSCGHWDYNYRCRDCLDETLREMQGELSPGPRSA